VGGVTAVRRQHLPGPIRCRVRCKEQDRADNFLRTAPSPQRRAPGDMLDRLAVAMARIIDQYRGRTAFANRALFLLEHRT